MTKMLKDDLFWLNSIHIDCWWNINFILAPYYNIISPVCLCVLSYKYSVCNTICLIKTTLRKNANRCKKQLQNHYIPGIKQIRLAGFSLCMLLVGRCTDERLNYKVASEFIHQWISSPLRFGRGRVWPYMILINPSFVSNKIRTNGCKRHFH